MTDETHPDLPGLTRAASDIISVRRVFGEPYELGGTLVVPVAKVMGWHGVAGAHADARLGVRGGRGGHGGPGDAGPGQDGSGGSGAGGSGAGGAGGSGDDGPDARGGAAAGGPDTGGSDAAQESGHGAHAGARTPGRPRPRTARGRSPGRDRPVTRSAGRARRRAGRSPGRVPAATDRTDRGAAAGTADRDVGRSCAVRCGRSGRAGPGGAASARRTPAATPRGSSRWGCSSSTTRARTGSRHWT